VTMASRPIQAASIDPHLEAIDVRPERGSRFRRAAQRGWEWVLTSPSRMRLSHVGRGVRLAPPIWTHGERSIRIGDYANIWHHARIIALNTAPNEIRIDIAARVAIHPYVAGSRSAKGRSSRATSMFLITTTIGAILTTLRFRMVAFSRHLW